jgi:hypothetical protein
MSNPLFGSSRRLWEPRAEQLRGVKLLVENPGARLFLPPGKGKTSVVLKAFEILKKAGVVDHLMVIAPLRVITTSWPQELARWTFTDGMKAVLIHGGIEERQWAMNQNVDIYLMNVEGLVGREWKLKEPSKAINPLAREFLKNKKIMLVIDESTKFKNGDSQRFKTLKKYLRFFEQRVILTGTPKPNKIEDLFSQCYITDEGDDLGRYVTHFRGEYMQASYDGGYMPQPGASGRIAAKIAPTTLTLEDDEAVPLEFVDYWLPMPEEAKKHYDKMKEEFLAVINGETVMAPNIGVQLNKLRQICQGYMYIDGQPVYIHTAKIDMLENLLEELNGDPLFGAYAFKPDLLMVNGRLGREAPYIGSGVSANQGALYCRAFSSGAMPLLLGHPQSVAHGVDGLQNECNKIVWFGLDWSWENTYQLHKRIARHGTKADSVTVYRIMIDCGVERAMLAAVADKQASEAEFLELLRKNLQ